MDTVHFYTDGVSEWRWHRKNEAGEVISESPQGYVDIDTARDEAIAQFGDEVRFVYDEPDDKAPVPDQENPAE